jgi:beta-phosphoglucomutase-like phosphatase (HAD superfamily)
VAIEDSIGGIQSAHEAGMRCLAIAHSYGPDRLRVANPEWVIASIADFESWLEKEVSK